MTARDIAAALPEIETLRRRCQAVAMLDAIICPEPWDDRYHSYVRDWGDGNGCAQLRNGSGDDCFVVFNPGGVFIRGFDHESPMTPWRTNPAEVWPGLLDGVPAVFAEYLTEPALSLDGVLAATYLIWRQDGESSWQTSSAGIADDDGDPEGAHQFLSLLLDPSPQSYHDFARWYFEVSLDTAATAHIYDLRPIDDRVVRALNPAIGRGDLTAEIESIGYPA